MRNSYFNLPTYITDDNYEVKDIVSANKYKKITDDFLKENENFWYYKNIQDNTRLELLAHLEYDNSSLWDILFVINQMDNVWDLPKSEDYVSSMTETKTEEFLTLFGQERMEETLNLRRESIYTMYFNQNEKHRKFRFFYIQYLPNLIEKLKANTK